MYSAQSPTLSSAFDEHHLTIKHASSSPVHRLGHYSSSFTSSSRLTGPIMSPTTTATLQHQQQQQQKTSVQCLRFKYFTTFFVCTTCLALLSASLATHKWLISKPIRILRLNNGQTTNFTALMLTAVQDNDDELPATTNRQQQQQKERLFGLGRPHALVDHQAAASARSRSSGQSNNHLTTSTTTTTSSSSTSHQSNAFLNESPAISITSSGGGQNSKFHGDIYFGLFNGVKVLNYGFGDRVSQLSVVQAYFSQPKDGSNTAQPQHELINFKFWLITLTGVVLAIIFALVGSIFAIINFVMTPRATMTGPVGLVIWNAAACFSCLMSMFAWLVEYFIRLKGNVLTPEEVANGWTSENRTQFGYSYYFVVLAFILHLVNIFIVSIVQSETWTSKNSEAAKRQARSACEGVIMLY